MGTLLVVGAAALLVSAILTMMNITREAAPRLNAENQVALREGWRGRSFDDWRKHDRAIGNAWKEHARAFPRSRKRALLAVFLLAGVLLVIAYALWAGVGGR